MAKVYLRLLLRDGERYDRDEEAALRSCLAAVATAEVAISRHPRGGYAVHFESATELEALLRHVREHGYLAVI